MSIVRKTAFAGSWYKSDSAELNSQLQRWLSAVDNFHCPARAIISPHAGYIYSGACAAYAYKQIDPKSVKRIFVLGPSHYLSLRGACALSSADLFETPLGSLQIDKEIYGSLRQSGSFRMLKMDEDRTEHSIEVQMPYVAKVMENYLDKFTVVPVMVGDLTPDDEASFGEIFAKYLCDPETIFVISSDFCHWGKRFSFTYYNESDGPIWKCIQTLDEMGMKLIEDLNPKKFNNYIAAFRNTICGRHAITVFLFAVAAMRIAMPNLNFELKFVKYAQSERCVTEHQSSVSYASAALKIT